MTLDLDLDISKPAPLVKIVPSTSLSNSPFDTSENQTPPPPVFQIPPPPIPDFVDHTCHQEENKMLTNTDLIHLSSYLIIGCILLMVVFTMAACALRCCTSSHFLSSSNDCQSEGLLDHCDIDEEVASHSHSSASNTHQPHETSSSSWWWWPQTSDRSFTSWKKRLRHSIEAVRQLRGHHPREYSINEDAPPLRPPGPHSSSSREAADFWRKSDSSEELKGSSSASASNNQSDWPLSPLMASEADISEAADASGHNHSASASAGLLQNQPAPTSIVVIPSVSRNVVPGDPRNGGHQRH